jgi:ubiquinone/menaquinone biosynthesis C-methylase UbiE
MSALKPKSRDEIAAAYSSEPWWYDLRGLFILTFAYNSTITSQLRFFGPNFGAQHLDVACGTGTLLELLLRWRRWHKLPESKIIGIDYAESMLAGAYKRFSKESSVEVQHADAAYLPFPDNMFDTANIANAVHCLPDVAGALLDIHRVLKPNGQLAVNVLLFPRTFWPFNRIAERINQWGIKKGILYTPYEQADIRQKFIDSGYEILTESVSGNCLNILCCKKILTL